MNNIDISNPDFQSLIKSLDILLEDLTQEQISGLEKFAEKIKNPANLRPEEAIKIVNDLGIDIEALQKKAKRLRAEERQKTKKPKIPVNDPCICGSGLKYKKCCRNP